MWCLQRDILLTTQHLLGIKNVIAHRELSDEGSLPILLLQLETRSPGRSNRCFSPRWGTSEGLCQPPLEPHRESTSEGGVSRGAASDTDCSNMAVRAIVSQATKPASLQPTEDRSSTSGNTSGSNSIPSRVAYLRQHYKDQKLLSEASDLLLLSWRQKTSQSYNSLSKKWISWFTEKQCDPISGPIEDVVSFLAHLYKDGYQYRSLNAYRSAIASMHTPIVGVSVGHHQLVSRLLKRGVSITPPPRYQGTWDVSVVLHRIGRLQPDQNLSLKELSLRTVMLLALTRPSRSTDILKLNLKGYRNTPEGAVFTPTALAK
uniref:Core-binding (CB) domain-containing protein n=1 Tax=Amphimedon queenslandica TaxID=400682 RepID=A0A1X7UKX7_AMPQE